jgi:adenine phosphoribosyltransferase
MTDRRPAHDLEVLKAHIRDVPDFPQPGILFRDITPLLADHESFQLAVDALASPFRGVD